MIPRRVLVVDDSRLMHKMYEAMLRQHPLVHAYDGLEALDHLERVSGVDLVLLDLNMPRMDGLEFLERLRGSRWAGTAKVLLIASSGDADELTRGLELGAAGFLEKPFDIEALHDKILQL